MKVNKRRVKKFLRIFTISIVSLLLVSISLFFIFLDSIIESRIKSLIEKKFGSYYTLSFDDIEKDIRITNMTFVVNHPKFVTDTSDFENMERYPVIFFEAKELRIENLNTWDVLLGSDLELESLILSEPQLDFYTTKGVQQKTTSKAQEGRNNALLNQIKVENLAIENGTVNIVDFDSKHLLLSNESTDITIETPVFNLNQMDDIASAFQFEKFNISSSQTRFTPKNSIYSFSLDTLSIQSHLNAMALKRIAISTKESLKEESEKLNSQRELVNIIVSKIDIFNFDFNDLIYNQEIDIQKIVIAESDFDIFKNKTTTAYPHFTKSVLNKMIRKVPFPFSVDTIDMESSHLTFELMNSKAVTPAKINLVDVSGTIFNFNNDLQRQDTLQIECQTRFMNVGDLAFEVKIAVHDSVDNYQEFKGTLGKMNYSEFNPIIQNFINIKIREGTIDHLAFYGTCTKEKSKGYVEFAYSDLKIDVYSLTDKTEEKKNKFLSFISGIAYYNNNPTKLRPMERKYFSFTKKDHQGSVMMWVGGILDGMLKTILKDFVGDQIQKDS